MDRVTDLEKEVTELRNKASGLKVQVQEVNWRGYKLAENIEEEESAKAKGATKQAPTSQEKPTKKSRLVDRISILTEEIEGARDRISELTDDAEDLQDEFSHVIKRGNVSKRKIAIRDMGNRLEKIKKEVSILVKTLDKLSQEAKALEEKLKDTTTMEREEAEDELENLLDVMRDLAYALEDLEDLEEGPEVEALKVVLRELIQATKNVTADLEEEIAEKIGMEEIPALKGVEHLTQEIKEVTRNVEQIVGELSE
jgi:chromosome segregation ATPase